MTYNQFFYLLLGFTSLGLFIYYLITKKYGYWQRKNVPHLTPSFLFGNYKEYILLNKYFGQAAGEICQRFPDAPYVGTYLGTEPALLLQDPEMIKLVLAKDYSCFSGREVSNYCDREVVTQCMFFQSGDSWKIARQNLTPLFSAAKMKNMFHLIQKSSDAYDKYIARETAKSPVIEAKKLTSLFTMDCICSCVFGIDTKLMDGVANNPFPKLGRALYSISKWDRLKGVFRSIWPFIFYNCGLQYFDPILQSFFTEILADVMKNRKDGEPLRHDFVDLLLTWKKLQYLSGSSLINGKPLSIKVTDDLLVSQCVQLFGAGFETAAATLAFALFELSKNKHIQSKVHEEVDEYFKKYDGKLEYECINEMPFLEACLNETMRLYPVIGLITRECMFDYTFPTGLRIEKGMRVHIPTFYVHRNPKYFPEPEVFRPERFLAPEKSNIIPYSYIPFGEGPRMCIGMRFSKIMTIPAMLTIFRNFEVERAENMSSTIDFIPGAITTQAMRGMYLKLTPRS